jgi:DNA-binding transcriptional regulator LsrR (DeoR family)
LGVVTSTPIADDEAALAARAAWLYFAGGKTQAEVAEALNVPNTKAHRLIARASKEGMIRVFVEGPIAGCVALEETLKLRFGLKFCEVVPNVDDDDTPMRSLGVAGARYIRGLIEQKSHEMIGVGHGRTLAAAIDHLPGIPANGTKFVSLLGGLTRRFAANPYDCIHRLAERTGAEAYLMPVPFFANSVDDKQVLLAQYGVRDVIDLARQATLNIAGIGEVNHKAFLSLGGMVSDEEIDQVSAAGATGEILGHFFDAEGREISNDLSDRALAPPVSELRTRKIVALAGGARKVRAIRSIIASGLLHGLITDEATARRLAEEQPGGGPGKTKNGEAA